MSFKRAAWHSGLTYRQTCPRCHAETTYTDYNLDFRPWYADGFIYCSRCKTPLRHRETFAINEDGTPVYPAPAQTPQPGYAPPQPGYAPQPAPAPAQPAPPVAPPKADVCPNCGRPYVVGDAMFCAGCGQKLGQPAAAPEPAPEQPE